VEKGQKITIAAEWMIEMWSGSMSGSLERATYGGFIQRRIGFVLLIEEKIRKSRERSSSQQGKKNTKKYPE
jgi:hypothetical protein